MARLRIPLLVLVLALAAYSIASGEEFEPQVGDVVFHTSNSRQSQAVQLATHSKWSHVAVVVKSDDGWSVVEAVQPVRVVPLKDFLDRGTDGHFAAYRPRVPLTAEQAAALTEGARRYIGLDYDLYFGWDESLMYCSELVWKAYKAAGIELSAPRRLTDFDLSSPTVARLMAQRWPGGVPDDVAVSPQDLADSALLKPVAER